MKKIVFLLIMSLQLKATQGNLNPEIFYDAMGNALKAGAKGVAINARYITNTQTDEEKNYYKCQKENEEIKRKLDERKINYSILIKEKIKTNKIFLTKEETIIENQILRQIAKSNEIYIEEEKINNKAKNKAKNDLLNQMRN